MQSCEADRCRPPLLLRGTKCPCASGSSCSPRPWRPPVSRRRSPCRPRRRPRPTPLRARRGDIPISRAPTRTTTRPARRWSGRRSSRASGRKTSTPEEFAKLVKDRNDAFNQGRRGHRVRRRAAAADASHLRQLRAQEQARLARGGSARRPDSAADRGSAAPAARARRREHQRQPGRPLQQLARHGPLRSLHHPRHPCVDDAGRLRQLLRHRAVARQRGDPLRDDPRDARGAVRSAPARVARHQAVSRRRAGLVGGRDPGGGDAKLSRGRPRRSGAARRW